MKCFGPMVIGFLFALGSFGQSAAAGPAWGVGGFSTTWENAPKVVAATDKLMASAAGKEFPGRLLLQSSLADGANPATHSFVVLYHSAAEREAFTQKLYADPAWGTFINTIQQLTKPVSSTRYTIQKSWGDIADSDTYWEIFLFDVNNPAGFATALETFMASATGQKSPGQVHLSSVAAGGLTPVSHIVSVGYASAAEAEAWNEALAKSAEWQPFLDGLNRNSEYLGAAHARTMKQWGPATLKDVTSK